MSGLKYKNIRSLVYKLYSYFDSHEEAFVILTLSFLSLMFTLGLASTLIFATLILLVAALILSVNLKSFFVGFLIIAVYSFQFVNPSKFYLVEVLKGYEIREAYFVAGRLLRYGIYTPNIFLALTVLFGLLESLKKKGRKSFNIPRAKIFSFVLPALGFLLFGLGISLLRSPFPVLSTIWTIQYSQVFLVAALVFYFYLKHKDKLNLFFAVVYFNIFLQFIIGTLQFFKQAPLGIPIEATETLQLTRALDATSFYRATGTFGVSIQLALISLVNLTIILPQALEKKKVVYLIAVAASFVTLIFTQSRTGWIGFVLAIILALKLYAKEAKDILLKTYRKIFVLLLITGSLLSFVAIPRILLSLNSGYEGGGLPLRKLMLEEGQEAFSLSPILGYGAGMNEATLYSLFPDGVMNIFPMPVLEGHLQFLLEFGIVGAFFLAIPFYLTTRKIVNTALKEKGLIGPNKSFTISFLLGTVFINLHYLFQSHDAVVEFPYLGLVLGVGVIAAYSKSWYKGAEK